MDNVSKRELLVDGYMRNNSNSISVFPASVKDSCFAFSNSSINTKILTFDEESMLNDILTKQLKEKKVGYKLLFRASEHEYSAAKYHELCDDIPSILVIIQNEHKHIFGGYCSISLQEKHSRDHYKGDKNAFLYLLRSSNPDASIPKIYEVKPNANGFNMAIWYSKKKGPCFGAGQEIEIVDKCDKVKQSYSRPGYGYHIDKTDEICGGGDTYTNSDGNGKMWKYLVLDYEVFQVINND